MKWRVQAPEIIVVEADSREQAIEQYVQCLEDAHILETFFVEEVPERPLTPAP